MAEAFEVDPRTEADAQIARALQIVVDAGDEDDHGSTVIRRDYTPDELDTLFFALTMASVQLLKTPGGREAHDRANERARAELHRRNLPQRRHHHEAVEMVKRTFGRDVDLSEGTTGATLVAMVEAEMRSSEKMLEDLIAQHTPKTTRADDLESAALGTPRTET